MHVVLRSNFPACCNKDFKRQFFSLLSKSEEMEQTLKGSIEFFSLLSKSEEMEQTLKGSIDRQSSQSIEPGGKSIEPGENSIDRAVNRSSRRRNRSTGQPIDRATGKIDRQCSQS